MRPGREPVAPPAEENLFLAKDVERLLASQSVTATVAGLDSPRIFSQVRPTKSSSYCHATGQTGVILLKYILFGVNSS